MSLETANQISGTPAKPINMQDVGKLNEAVRGKADAYTGKFQQAFLDQGHPIEEFIGRNVGAGTGSGVVKQGVVDLAQPFVEEYYKATGSMPSIDEVDQFVSGNMNSGYLNGVINGTNNPAMVASQIVQPYIQSNPNIQGKLSSARNSSLQDQTNQMYASLGNYLTDKINRDTAGKMQQNYESEAALGRLHSPASIATASRVQEQGQNALAGGLAQLGSTQATGNTDLAKTIANIQESGRQSNMNYGLKNKELGMNEEQINQQGVLGRQQIGLGQKIGELQAGAKKPGVLDYINTGVNVAKLFG